MTVNPPESVSGVVSPLRVGNRVDIDYEPHNAAIRITIRQPMAITPIVARIPFHDFTERVGGIIIQASRVAREIEKQVVAQLAEQRKRGD